MLARILFGHMARDMFPDRLAECLEVGTIYVSQVGTEYVLVRRLDGFGFGTESVSRRSGDSWGRWHGNCYSMVG